MSRARNKKSVEEGMTYDPSSSSIYISEETQKSRASLLLVEKVRRMIKREKQRSSSEALETLESLIKQIALTLKNYEDNRKKTLLEAIDPFLHQARKVAEGVSEKERVLAADLKMAQKESEPEFVHTKSKKIDLSAVSSAEEKEQMESDSESEKETPTCCFFSSKPKKKVKTEEQTEESEHDTSRKDMASEDEEGDESSKKTASEEDDDKELRKPYKTFMKNDGMTADFEEDEVALFKIYKRFLAIQEESIKRTTALADSINKQFLAEILKASYSIDRITMFHLVRLYAAAAQFKKEWGWRIDTELRKFSCSKLKYNHGNKVFTLLLQLDATLKKKLIAGSYTNAEFQQLMDALLPLKELKSEKKPRSQRQQSGIFEIRPEQKEKRKEKLKIKSVEEPLPEAREDDLREQLKIHSPRS